MAGRIKSFEYMGEWAKITVEDMTDGIGLSRHDAMSELIRAALYIFDCEDEDTRIKRDPADRPWR